MPKAVNPNRGQPSAVYQGEVTSPETLATALAEIAKTLDSAADVDQTLHQVVRSAAVLIPGAESVGLTQVRRREQELDVRFASDDFVVAVDRVQYEVGEGPCLDAAYRHRTVRVDDFREEVRWPRFAAQASELGARSLFAIQLYVQDEDLAALNLYSRMPRAFDDESEQLGLLFATHAAIAMATARRDEQLRRAVDSRDTIGQAKGVLMERYKIDAGRAFQVLTRFSQDKNMKLRDVALLVMDGGHLYEPTDS